MKKIPTLGLFAGGVAVAVGIFMVLGDSRAPRAAMAGGTAIPDHPDWNWDVRPILSQNCFGCHGGGTREAGLRLDVRDVATGELPENKGQRAIVPGNLGKSVLVQRINSTDVDVRMPPKNSHKNLSARDIAVLERWIDQGADYKPHWAYIEPDDARPGRSPWKNQAVNRVDRYIHAALVANGLSPAKEADRETLINRVTLDLTGLPPTLAEVDAFVAAKDPNAYEALVDRLLDSTEYAERQANIWLDVARYADTRGRPQLRSAPPSAIPTVTGDIGLQAHICLTTVRYLCSWPATSSMVASDPRQLWQRISQGGSPGLAGRFDRRGFPHQLRPRTHRAVGTGFWV